MKFLVAVDAAYKEAQIIGHVDEYTTMNYFGKPSHTKQ